MKKDNFLKQIFNMKYVVIAMVLFFISIALATFVENDYGTVTAKALIYNASWFEAIQVYLGLSVAYNIYRFKLLKKEKFPILLFHISFIIILIGAGVTRYFGFEGIMHIRENQVSNTILSDKAYLHIKINDGKKIYSTSKYMLNSELTNNNFKISKKIGDKEIKFSYVNYIHSAQEILVDDKNGKPALSIVYTKNNQRQSTILMIDNKFNDKELNLKFLSHPTLVNGITIFKDKNKLKIISDKEFELFDMMVNKRYKLKANTPYDLKIAKLYTYDNKSFVIQQYFKHAVFKVQKTKNYIKNSTNNALIVKVEVYNKDKKQSKIVSLIGSGGVKGEPKTITLDNFKIELSYGARVIKLPFSIKLRKFILKRYAGSMTPSSYASEVSVIDTQNGKNFDFRIFMNHVLDYGGYRFYQSSYDPDEKGTILSVNHDKAGTYITYLGYLLMSIGMFLTLFFGKSQFARMLKNTAPKIIVLFVLLNLQHLQAENINSNMKLPKKDVIKVLKSYNKEHAKKFGSLVMQGSDGRMKPVDTFAYEAMAKIHKRTSFLGLTPSQILLSMLNNPSDWEYINYIKVSHPEIKKIIGIDPNSKYAPFGYFFDVTNKGITYKLDKLVQEATRKKPSDRNKLDKDALKVDERVNIMYNIFQGQYITIFPDKDDNIHHKWYTPAGAINKFKPKDSNFVRMVITNYFNQVDNALKTGNWEEANKALEYIAQYQQKAGSAIIPSKTKIDLELAYNKYQIFLNLLFVYLILGFTLLIFEFINIATNKQRFKIIIKILKSGLVLAFVAHTLGLILRGYIAGRAPWSDGYESMIYIGWATMIAGLIFARRTPIVLSSSAILTAIILFVAHLSWLDPQISNLVPVLKSYWLTIHVSVITASYGFFGLSALIGFFNLILMITKRYTKKNEICVPIANLSNINELSLTIGLFLLTIGTFLGGVWANESWGRYWSWDPKETWSLATILVYAVVLHLRYIPKFNFNYFILNSASIIAFYSVLMTYFGVNYFLSGMHSYAKGDGTEVPNFVWYSMIIIFSVIFMANKKEIKK